MAFPNLRTDVSDSMVACEKSNERRIFIGNICFQGMALWKDVTYNSRGFLMQTAILREVARIHDAYFE